MTTSGLSGNHVFTKEQGPFLSPELSSITHTTIKPKHGYKWHEALYASKSAGHMQFVRLLRHTRDTIRIAFRVILRGLEKYLRWEICTYASGAFNSPFGSRRLTRNGHHRARQTMWGNRYLRYVPRLDRFRKMTRGRIVPPKKVSSAAINTFLSTATLFKFMAVFWNCCHGNHKVLKIHY